MILAELLSGLPMHHIFLDDSHHCNLNECCPGCSDLHQNIGRGEIGPGCFERLMADPRLDGLPLIMETPAQSEGPPIDFVQSLQQVYFRLLISTMLLSCVE